MQAESRTVSRINRPRDWVVRRVDGGGWFTTRVTWDLQDGRSATWTSRMARRRGRIELHDAAGRVTGTVEAEPATAQRLARLNLIAAISFMIGGSLFCLGAYFAEAEVALRTVNTTYLVGGVFFSLGGYVSVLQATNTPTDIDEHGSLSSKWRWWRDLRDHLGWSSAVVLFVGTLFFAVSLVAAFAVNLTPRQYNGWIWFPDITGCICFLISGHLALLEVGHGHIGVRIRELGWWIVAVNQLGSVLFLLAGLAAFLRPATSTVVNEGLVNWGTFAGAACFVFAGLLQIFDRPAAAPKVVESHT